MNKMRNIRKMNKIDKNIRNVTNVHLNCTNVSNVRLKCLNYTNNLNNVKTTKCDFYF